VLKQVDEDDDEGNEAQLGHLRWRELIVAGWSIVAGDLGGVALEFPLARQEAASPEIDRCSRREVA
jgi:hypothetical protein